MKRLIALILALFMCAFAFVSCDNTDEDQNPIVTSENQQTTEKAENTDELYNGHGSAKLIPAQRESDGAQFYVSEYGSEELRKVWTSREWSDTPENVSFDFVLNQPEKSIYYNIESGIFVSDGKALKLTDSEKTTLTKYFSVQDISEDVKASSGGVTVNTVKCFLDSTDYDEATGMLAQGCGAGVTWALSNGPIPCLTLDEDISVELLNSNGSNTYLNAYDIELKESMFQSFATNENLKELAPGLYYVYMYVLFKRDFIKSHNIYTGTSYEYVFILNVK